MLHAKSDVGLISFHFELLSMTKWILMEDLCFLLTELATLPDVWLHSTLISRKRKSPLPLS